MPIPVALLDAINDVYGRAGIELTGAPEAEAESAEYSAFRLSLNGAEVVFRVARTTPTKLGQFVTIWKRPDRGGTIAPLDAADGVALVIVHVTEGAQSGQFVLDKPTLINRGVMSVDGRGGKRAIRVYPPWTRPAAKDAISTQRWQLGRFLSLDGKTESAAVARLFASIRRE